VNGDELARAWTHYWRQSAAAGVCLPLGPPDVIAALGDHWRSVARAIAPGKRLIDLGCGAGELGQLIAATNQAVEVVGIDFSQVRPIRSGRVTILPGVAIERLPFTEASFDWAISQFGIEYSDVARAAGELARVLAPGAGVDFAIHHSSSPIVAHNRRRSEALSELTGEAVGEAFVAGRREALDRALERIGACWPEQDVVAEFSAGLGGALTMEPPDRRQLWAGLRSKSAEERAILAALQTAAVSDIAQWLQAFEPNFSFESPRIIADRRGAAFGWAVKGRRS